jgi:hypothetical protein
VSSDDTGTCGAKFNLATLHLLNTSRLVVSSGADLLAIRGAYC